MGYDSGNVKDRIRSSGALTNGQANLVIAYMQKIGNESEDLARTRG